MFPLDSKDCTFNISNRSNTEIKTFILTYEGQPRTILVLYSNDVWVGSSQIVSVHLASRYALTEIYYTSNKGFVITPGNVSIEKSAFLGRKTLG